ncbi:MAG: N-acetyltransferase [Hyphomicrobiales bacterium]|nr:MAG: N-acetyltransferase [Hyphomicrobiales bacterium]
MSEQIEIRESFPADAGRLEEIYPAAFPDEDLVPLLRKLLAEDRGVLSLVAAVDGAVVGHVAFTTCGVDGGNEKLGLLGPLAVDPKLHRQGIGSALVRDGFHRLRDAGVSHVYVLGDPNYYGRFGFTPEYDLAPPYPLPDAWCDAWQAFCLKEGATSLKGALTVPEPWRQPSLWGA